MASRTSWLHVLALVSAASMPAAGAAQEPGAYGGGTLDAGALGRSYHPTVGVTFAPRGGQVALHFDTTLRCGRDSYQVRARRLVQPTGGHVASAGKGRLALGRGRVTWHWSLAADLDGRLAAGVLTIGGKRRAGGRTTSCTHAPQRGFRARAATAPTGAPALPAAGGSYLGLSAIRLSGGVPAPVVLRVGGSGRKAFARWTVSAPCRRGPAERLTNLTPPTAVAADGRFRRTERFKVRFSDALVRYRTSFAGRFTTDGALGTLRLRAHVYSRSGTRLITRCDTRARKWSALLDTDAAPASGQATAPGPQQTQTQTPAAWDQDRFITAGSWSLTMTSDVNDAIAHGQSFSYSTSDGPSYGKGGSGFLEFAYPNDAGNWDALFLPPPGESFVVGTTYTDSDRYTDPAGPPRATAKIEIYGLYTGCDTSTGTFTVESLAFDPNGMLRTARVRFEHHCEGMESALRGTWEFHAA